MVFRPTVTRSGLESKQVASLSITVRVDGQVQSFVSSRYSPNTRVAGVICVNVGVSHMRIQGKNRYVDLDVPFVPDIVYYLSIRTGSTPVHFNVQM